MPRVRLEETQKRTAAITSLFHETAARPLAESLLGTLEPVNIRQIALVFPSDDQLAHAGGPNTSPRIRYSVYFRLKAAGHDARRWECLTDVWSEWPGLAPVSGA